MRRHCMASSLQVNTQTPPLFAKIASSKSTRQSSVPTLTSFKRSPRQLPGTDAKIVPRMLILIHCSNKIVSHCKIWTQTSSIKFSTTCISQTITSTMSGVVQHTMSSTKKIRLMKIGRKTAFFESMTPRNRIIHTIGPPPQASSSV